MIQTPYLLFLGDAPDQLAAKVAQGIRDWRPAYLKQRKKQGNMMAKPKNSFEIAVIAGDGIGKETVP